MLKHEDNLQIPPQSAAEVRVTPEELAAAITRLEALTNAGQQRLFRMMGAIIITLVGIIIWGVSPYFTGLPRDDVSAASSALAEIGDTQPFYADLIAVGAISEGGSAGAVRVYRNDPHDGRHLWRMTKHDGCTYLQAYTRALQPPDKQTGLFDDSGLGTSENVRAFPITLPLKGLHWCDSLEDDKDRGATWVSNACPDRRVWEKWKP